MSANADPGDHQEHHRLRQATQKGEGDDAADAEAIAPSELGELGPQTLLFPFVEEFRRPPGTHVRQ